MTARVSAFAFLALVAALGCGEHEGDAPGECTDGADNDRDGYFDCDDQDCVFSPVCDGEGGGDTGTDTGGGDDPPDPRLLELTGVDIAYTMGIEFDLPVFGMDDCEMSFVGEGTQRVDAAGNRVTFEGSWRKTGGTCPPELDQVIWVDTSGDAFHSFVFSDDLAELDEWYAHKRADGYSTDEEAKPNWYITEMASTYDHGSPTVTYSLDEPVVDITGTLLHRVSFTFSK